MEDCAENNQIASQLFTESIENMRKKKKMIIMSKRLSTYQEDQVQQRN